jgi:hypothetical protein
MIARANPTTSLGRIAHEACHPLRIALERGEQRSANGVFEHDPVGDRNFGQARRLARSHMGQAEVA